MKKFASKLIESGIWMQPLIMIGIVKYLQETYPYLLNKKENWIDMLLLSFLPVLFFWSEMIGKPKEENALTGKQKAIYPAIPKKLLYKRPTGIVLGKDKYTQKYVCKLLEEDGHVFLIGGSGSGKSSCYVIPALLVNPKARILQ